jgi:chemosensory pili system protein ChpC
MSAVVESVRSLWVPLGEMKLLVPNVAIAEVVNYQPLDMVDGEPEWLVGRLSWRNQELPVVSMQQLLGGGPEQSGHGARISVFNSVRANTALPFYAIVTAGIPRLFNADADALSQSPHVEWDLPDTAADCVQIGGEAALIPNLELIQSLVEEAWRNV